MQHDHTVANMQHGSADLQDSLPEARVMTEKHAAGRVKTATMLPALLYHHALALGPAFPQPEIKIKVRNTKKTMPSGVNLLRSQVSDRAAQV